MEIIPGITLDEMEAEIPVVELKPRKGQSYGEICLMGDFHLGSGNFSLNQYLQYLHWITTHPEVKVGLMGDLVEMGSLSNYGASEEKVGSIQLVDLVELLKPLKERVIFMLEGNHEERFWKATKGTDTLTRSVADALRIKPLLPGPERGQLIVFKVGKQFYPSYLIHGYTGATIYKSLQLRKVFENIHTSLVAHGHIHQIFKDHRTYYAVRQVNSRFFLTVHEQYWLTTGCFVKDLGYAEKVSYPTTKIGAPFVRFGAEEQLIEIVDDPRVTYGIGKASLMEPATLGLGTLDLDKYTEKGGFGGSQIVLKYGRKWEETKLRLSKKASQANREEEQE